jgi:hypothetical protein
MSPLHHMIQHMDDNPRHIEEMLKRGAKIRSGFAPDLNLLSLLMVRNLKECFMSVVDQHGYDINEKNQFGRTPVHHFLEIGKDDPEILAFAIETGADPRILVERPDPRIRVEQESWIEGAYRFHKFKCVAYLADIGFQVIDVTNGKEMKNAKASHDLRFLMEKLKYFKKERIYHAGPKLPCLLGTDATFDRVQLVFRPTLCGNTDCKKMETKSKSFKMCEGCKGDDELEVKRVYCGKECANKDWKVGHRREHQSLVD